MYIIEFCNFSTYRGFTTKNIAKDRIKVYVESHLIDYDLLYSNNFEEHIITRAINILNEIEKATGKKITDRTSEDVINYFGRALI